MSDDDKRDSEYVAGLKEKKRRNARLRALLLGIAMQVGGLSMLWLSLVQLVQSGDSWNAHLTFVAGAGLAVFGFHKWLTNMGDAP